MIEKVLKAKNLTLARKQVIANKGAAGVDGMTVKTFAGFVVKEKNRIATQILNHSYRPQAIKGVEIPKSNGKTRLLGVPTLTDRWLQQAVSQVLAPLFEPGFSDHSFGFRPQRNALMAVQLAQKYIHEGYKHIVDIDLKSFFDEVDHAILLEKLYKKVKCPTTLRLIRKWLQAPILIKGKLVKRTKGVPQGSPLGPLLSNIILDELDQWMAAKGYLFVRYADDFSIYCKGKRRAQEAGNRVFLFLKNKLKLPINREKSGIRRPTDFTLLGYGFEAGHSKGAYVPVVAEKSWKKLKENLKETTRKTTPKTVAERIAKINEIQRGWLNYFRAGNITAKLKKIDSWLRNRLRYCIWHDWKKPERRRKNFIQLGIHPRVAYSWSRTRKGGWAVAQSPMMGTTITLKRLEKKGYQAMLELYKQLNPQQNEPLYTRPVCTVV